MDKNRVNNKKKETGMSRREFVGAVGAGIGTICILGAPGVVSAAEDSGSRIRSIMYDSTKCIGCHTCEKACKEANDLPWDVVEGKTPSAETSMTTETETATGTVSTDLSSTTETTGTTETTDTVTTTTTPENIAIDDDLDADSWVNVKVWEGTLEDETVDHLYIRQACMHCGSCARVCPAKALVQREDGIVTMDPKKCIGCHYCHAACPFDIPRYGEDGAMRKCIMCYGRVDEGKEPACVEVCPTDALTFGYRDELVENGRERISELEDDGYNAAYLYGEKELGGTPLMYALPYSYDNYELPKLSLKSQKPVTLRDFGMPVGIIAGIAAIAVGGITYIRNRGEKASGDQTDNK